MAISKIPCTDPVARTKEIERRQRAISRGDRAHILLDNINVELEALESIFLKQLVNNTKIGGDADVHACYMLTAIHEFRTLLLERIERGEVASRRLAKEKEQAGGGE